MLSTASVSRTSVNATPSFKSPAPPARSAEAPSSTARAAASGRAATTGATPTGIQTPSQWTWPDPRNDKRYAGYNSFAPIGKDRNQTIAIIGDSLSSNDKAGESLYGLGKNWVTGFGRILQRRGFRVENYSRSSAATRSVPGVNGRNPTLPSGLAQIARVFRERPNTKLVVIALGTNDPRRNISATGTRTTLARMAQYAISKGAKVMFIPIQGTSTTLRNASGQAFNNAEIAEFRSIWGKLANTFSRTGKVTIGPWMYSGGLHPDGIHTSASSQAARASSFVNAAARVL